MLRGGMLTALVLLSAWACSGESDSGAQAPTDPDAALDGSNNDGAPPSDAGDGGTATDASDGSPPQDGAPPGDAGDAASDAPPVSPCKAPTDAERKLLHERVHAYLTGADTTLPNRYQNDWGHICFEDLAAAIRDWPLSSQTPSGQVFTAQYKAPLLQDPQPVVVYEPTTAKLDGSVRVPLLVWLHGAGGPTGTHSLELAAEQLGAIMVAPTAPLSCDWSGDDACASQTHGAIAYAKQHYPIDHDRVYVSGFSMGGRGSFTVGLVYPDLFAGLFPVAGTIGAALNTQDENQQKSYVRPHVENAGGQRVKLMTGGQDHPLLIAQNSATEKVAGEFGYDFDWELLPNEGHSWPEQQWRAGMQWLAQASRDPYPNPVIYNMGWLASSTTPDLFLNVQNRTNAFWVQIDERKFKKSNARVKGEITGSNIAIQVQNVAKLRVFLAPELIDMEKPITITVNGQPWFSGVVEPDGRFALEHALRRSERSMVFAGEVAAALP